jgi:CTP:molybdopterin cytidylyltransferase MocA
VLDAAKETDEKTLVVPTFRRRRGHPLVIPAALRERILAWPDTARLNLLFEEKDLSVLHLEGFDESILHDVDRPEDLMVRR